MREETFSETVRNLAMTCCLVTWALAGLNVARITGFMYDNAREHKARLRSPVIVAPEKPAPRSASNGRPEELN